MITNGLVTLYVIVGFNFFLSFYVYMSCNNRDMSDRLFGKEVWAVQTFFLGLGMIPIFHATRPLKEDEVRKGGKLYIALRGYSRIIILGLIVFLLGNCAVSAQSLMPNPSDAETLGWFFGNLFVSGFVIVISFITWAVPHLFKSDKVEEGPTS
jgi:hypothetical protein